VRYDGCPEKLLNHLRNQIKLVSNYPEPNAISLRKIIAEKYDLEAEQVLLCNGSSDGFYQIAQSFSGLRSAILHPSFSEYEDACKMHNHSIHFFRKEEFNDQPFNSFDLVWVGNPNNPDGHIFDLKHIQEVVAESAKTIFVIDEAFIQMNDSASSAISIIQKYQNLIVCRSLTKAFGIPGLRLGYLLSCKKVTKRLNEFAKPWSVNSMAIEAGKFILQHEEELMPDVKHIQMLSKSLQQEINQINGFDVLPSETGFFLVKMVKGTVSDLQKFLLQNHQLAIRSASNFRGLNEQFFRIGIQSEEKNDLLISALQNYTSHADSSE
jgi:threonine-phosphate decarboxylase